VIYPRIPKVQRGSRFGIASYSEATRNTAVEHAAILTTFGDRAGARRQRHAGRNLTVSDSFRATVFSIQPLGLRNRKYVLNVRIETAKRLLSAPNLSSIAEVAQRVGFADQGHFSRTFKRVTDSAPAAFARARQL
jgi:AraC-like DNA-binding protein